MFFVVLLCLSMFLFSDLFSYIDPGSGSFLIQLMIAFFAGSLFFAKSFFRKAKLFFSKNK
jgi:predicted membrane channel-forming protein YqfA (hemolysin III family)